MPTTQQVPYEWSPEALDRLAADVAAPKTNIGQLRREALADRVCGVDMPALIDPPDDGIDDLGAEERELVAAEAMLTDHAEIADMINDDVGVSHELAAIFVSLNESPRWANNGWQADVLRQCWALHKKFITEAKARNAR